MCTIVSSTQNIVKSTIYQDCPTNAGVVIETKIEDALVPGPVHVPLSRVPLDHHAFLGVGLATRLALTEVKQNKIVCSSV